MTVPPGATIAIKPIEVVSLSREWAYEFGTSITTYTPEGADTAQQLRDTYLVLFRNTGDGSTHVPPVGNVRPERLQPGASLRGRVVGTQAGRLAAAPR